MEEDSVFLEDASPIKRSVKEADSMNPALAEVQIHAAYDQYTTCRATLTESYENLQQPAAVRVDHAEVHADKALESKASRSDLLPIPATKVLPHLPLLAQITHNERLQLQHSAYLESQVSSADQEIQEALLRLSGESHLLPAGSKDVAAWGNIATATDVATGQFVQQYLQASRKETSSVSALIRLCSLQSQVLASNS